MGDSASPGFITVPYAPRPFQLEIHNSLKSRNVLVCHRRFGKTVLSINELIKGAATCRLERPRFAYVAPFFVQAKTIAWDYLKHYTSVIPGVQKNEQEMRVDFPGGARIQLFGADNPDRLRGLYFDGIVLDEYADMSPSFWSKVVTPALSDRSGWATFIGTPKGRNQFWELYERAQHDPDWFAAIYRASQTGVVSPVELEKARSNMTEDEYEQEYECSFQAALVGAYYGREISAIESSGRITDVSYDPRLPVHTAWDLGMDDSTAIWFIQVVGTEFRVIDHYANNGEGLAHYARVLGTKPYVYGDHYLPHDTEVRELGTGKSRVETLQSLGIKPTVVPSQSIEDGINAVRLMLPRCWFNEPSTRQGIKSLRQYQRKWDDVRKTFSTRPLHDWTSHDADAFRTFATGYKDGKKKVANLPPPRRLDLSPMSGSGWMGS